MNRQGAAHPDSDNTMIETSEKDELMRVGRLELEKKADERRAAIKRGADQDRARLYERLGQTSEIERGDLQVCQVRFDREIEQLREAIYGGEKFIPGPIRRLPVELLGYIFRYHVDSGLSPWILVKVSQKWMRTAMATPHLWSYLLLDGSPHKGYTTGHAEYVANGKKHICIGNWQFCPDTAEADAALHRSGAVPIHVRIQGDSWPQPGVFDSFFFKILSGLLSPRIYSLDISRYHTRSIDFPEEMRLASFPQLRKLNLPQPTFQHISVEWTSRLIERVSLTSSHLEELSFSAEVPSNVGSYSFWSRLKTLKLEGTGWQEALNQVVPQICDLQQFDHWTANWPNAETPVSTWENIREIRLLCDGQYLHRLRLPNLESLKITIFRVTLDMNQTTNSNRIFYPMLTTLDLDTSDVQWPELTATSFPSVVNLTLKTLGDDGMIIDILQTVPKVRNLTIAGSSRLNQNFGLLFLPRLYSEQELLCPDLQKLRLGEGNYETVHTTKRQLVPLVKELDNFRRQIGQPLHELVVRWKYRKEVIDYAGYDL